MMLLDLANRVTTEEAPLEEVLKGDKQLNKRFPDAERLLGEVSFKWVAMQENWSSMFPTSSDINQSVPSRKKARSLKFWILEVE